MTRSALLSFALRFILGFGRPSMILGMVREFESSDGPAHFVRWPSR